MKQIKRLALLMAFVLLVAGVLAGCGNQGEDVLAVVGETNVYRWQFDRYMDEQLVYQLQLTGHDITKDAEAYREYKQTRLEDLIGEAALKEEARSRGMYDLTAEEEKQIDEQYLEYYNTSITQLMEQLGGDDTATRRKAENQFEDFLKEHHLTPDRVREIMLDDYVLANLMEELSGEIDLSEEDLQEAYESMLETQKTSTEEDPSWLGTNTPSLLVYVPEGYVKVIRMFVSYSGAQLRKIQEATEKLATAAQEYMQALADGALNTSIKEDAYNRAATAYENILNNVYEEQLQEKRPILEAAQQAEDFKTFVEENTEEDLAYFYVCEASTNVSAEFRDAALALENPGDVSDFVQLDNGICVISLLEKLTPGEVGYENVKEELRKQLVENTIFTNSMALRQQYAQAADEKGLVTRYLDKL